MFRLAPMVAVATLALAGCGAPFDEVPPQSRPFEAWDTFNAPSRMEWDVERTLSKLPLKARTSITPWADTYWPTQRAGLAWRWNSSSPGASRGYALADKASLRRMTQAQIKALSPAEKYDIFVGRYDYPLVQAEWKRTSRGPGEPAIESWEGLCHGWAHAAINYKEPKPVVVRNADGIEIPFGSSDVKALLTFFQGDAFDEAPPRRFLGLRCDDNLARTPSAANSDACRDTNAGSFHLLLAHYVAKLDIPLVADVTRDLEVWNHPIFSYSVKLEGSQPPSQGAAPGTVREVRVQTTVDFVREGPPRWQATVGTTLNPVEIREYRYRLELDADDRIIGGAWEANTRPDFLWVHKRPPFSGYYEKLEQIYELSTSTSEEAAL